MKLRLGFSPCPNDTFIFDALVHNRIDTGGLVFEPVLADVEELNRLAFAGELAVTKLSYHAMAYVADKYAILDAGSALGRGCGPLLIARQSMTKAEIEQARIAIPGKYTTANLLLGLAYPVAQNKKEMLFSDIEKAVQQGEVDAGLIIHENRFTFADFGLVQILDLGEYWETFSGLPIPLGCIAVNRALPQPVQLQVQQAIRQSVEVAFAEPSLAMPYIRQHAQAMSDAVMQAHIDLYVNEFSLSLQDEGRQAITKLYEAALTSKLLPDSLKVESLFVE